MRFFKVVFPTLPVIPIIFASVLSLVTLAKLFSEENVLLTLSKITMFFYPDALEDHFDKSLDDIVKISLNNKVDHGLNVLIGKNVNLGINCSIGHNTIIESNVVIGDNVL